MLRLSHPEKFGSFTPDPVFLEGVLVVEKLRALLESLGMLV